MQQGFEFLSKRSFLGLEEKLQNALKPVNPNPEFVNALKLKLSQTPSVIMESTRKHLGILFLVFGLVAGSLVYWLYRRFKE